MTEEEVLQAIAQAKQTRSVDLTLSGEGITTIPPEIGELTQVVKLNLKDNKLISLPPEIGKLTNLQRLYLSNNKITELPPEIGQLENLEIIYAGNNKLTSIPAQLGQLTKLQGLYLNDNSLTELPPEIQNLTNLRNLDLRKNNLTIPKDLLEKVHQPLSIVKYYLQYQSAEAAHLYETKIIVLGSTGVGKTSVVQQLMGRKFNQFHIKTVGLNSQIWQTDYNEEKLTIHFWDFPEAENMQSIYNCAFSQNCLYLLVTESIEDFQKVDYWLSQVSSIAKTDPVILIINKIDQGLTNLDRTTIAKTDSGIRNFTEISCKKQNGIDYLKTIINEEIDKLTNITSKIPPNWIGVKNSIASVASPFINYEEYQNICKQEVVLEEKEQQDLANFLADIGVIIYRQNYLAKPEWFINNLEQVFNNTAFQEATRGLVNLNQLQQLLELTNIQESRFFLDVIQGLELGFSTDTPDTIIIPALLQSQEPDGDWETATKVEYKYAMFSPLIIPRLTVRMSKYIENNLYWRNGVVFNVRGDRGMVQANHQTKIVSISVTGKPETSADLLKNICGQLEKVNQLTPGIKANKVKPQSAKQPSNQTPPEVKAKTPAQPTPTRQLPAKTQSPTSKATINSKWLLYGGLFVGTIVLIIILSILF